MTAAVASLPTCAVPDCRQTNLTDGELCNKHYSRLTRFGDPCVQLRFDAAPLIRAVEDRGGYQDPERVPWQVKPSDRWLARSYQRARTKGWVTWQEADRLACRLLSVHPSAIWPDWFRRCEDLHDDLLEDEAS